MSKHVQVYFHDESEAEAFKATLAKYSTQDVFVDEIEHDDGRILVMPTPPATSSAAGVPPVKVSEKSAGMAIGFEKSDDDRPRRAVVDFKVSEADYQAVIEEARKNDGLLDQANI
ncbi:hypothetical protein HMI01_28000 [Halolactibacillus miurensis]|uniref:Heat induced stress protein YflT n=1 Tax=Halolactibacillus miurensis TaxID=306541 RepID=A0A1I6V3B3_9BACI|nr:MULTISPECIES: hypothetical protein [Halolactibacillus]GEM05812.1 hypothetical protein HMI01_28000 [Halolactibacillus miurensis]SFT08168.1 hypothetical protein SAMN05421668_1431 [Halolactibacillus miurensis]